MTTTMIPDVLAFQADPFACSELNCQFLDGYTLESCEKERHCPFAH